MHGVDVDMRTGSLMFDDSSIGYDYMWNKSFDNEYGKFGPAREVSGWDIKGGRTIVMPYYDNGLKRSENNYQNWKGNGAGLEVEFNGVWYPVETHVHTHPDYFGGKIGLTGSPDNIVGDYEFFLHTGLDHMNVIYNNKIHKVWYDYYNKKWDPIKIWPLW